MNRPVVYLWGLNVLGTASIVVSLITLVKSPISPAWLIPAGLAIVSGLTVLRMPSVAASFSIGDTFSFAALFIYGPEAATLTVALDTLAISTRLKGTPGRVIFNTAAPSLAMWCAGMLVFRVAGLTLPVDSPGLTSVFAGAGAAVAIYFVLGSGFVAAAVALHERQALGREPSQSGVDRERRESSHPLGVSRVSESRWNIDIEKEHELKENRLSN